jgi:methylenetetrahydrofolate dehydrogenase (NADP+) / methenyltetrahydrofolate cyclohydrolase
MTATIIDGNAVGNRIKDELKADVERFKEKYGYAPALGAVLAGDDPASAQYVRMKRRACEKIGVESVAHVMNQDSTQEDVEKAVRQLNEDPKVHGILVQLPLPPQVDEERILQLVSLEKDVDGFNPINIGKLAMKNRTPTFTPATPTGCMVLLEEVGAKIEGSNAVVIGRSNIVGLPMAMMLLKANATVTICHSRTKDIADIVKQADIVIAAIGWAEFVKAEWLKPGAVVIDVGTNQVDDPTDKRGYRWVGDVEFEPAKEIVSAISKVPGGVGPMTITTLLKNTVKAAFTIAEKAE